MINKNVITKVTTGFIAAIALGWLAGLLKVVSLGSETWQGSVKVLFIPVAKIDNTPDSFSIETSYGILVLGLIGGLIGYLVAKKSDADSNSAL